MEKRQTGLNSRSKEALLIFYAHQMMLNHPLHPKSQNGVKHLRNQNNLYITLLQGTMKESPSIGQTVQIKNLAMEIEETLLILCNKIITQWVPVLSQIIENRRYRAFSGRYKSKTRSSWSLATATSTTVQPTPGDTSRPPPPAALPTHAAMPRGPIFILCVGGRLIERFVLKGVPRQR